MFKKRTWLVVVFACIFITIATVTVVANPFTQESSEYDTELLSQTIGKIDTIIGDDPDEEGYQGKIVTFSGSSDSEEGVEIETIPFDSIHDGETLPDEIGISIPVSNPEWTDFLYNFSAGSTLRPRSSQTRWAYASGGCSYVTKGFDLFTLPLVLPQGSEIDYLRLYYYDENASVDMTAWITTYDGMGGVSDLVHVSSVGNPGYSYNISDFVGHIVDNATNSYVLNFAAHGTGDSLRLCGLRVAYRLP
jgi:hypothetical protein